MKDTFERPSFEGWRHSKVKTYLTKMLTFSLSLSKPLTDDEDRLRLMTRDDYDEATKLR